MTNLPAPLKRRWDDRFALDFAMTLEGSGDKPEALLARYRFTPEDLEAFAQEPLFMKKVEQLQAQLKAEGFSFKLKAKAQAELLLDTSWNIIHNDETSPAVKADLVKWTAKMAGYEPEKSNGPVDSGVKINIIMGGSSQTPPLAAKVIDHE